MTTYSEYYRKGSEIIMGLDGPPDADKIKSALEAYFPTTIFTVEVSKDKRHVSIEACPPVEVNELEVTVDVGI